jgi:hypothetical protein
VKNLVISTEIVKEWIRRGILPSPMELARPSLRMFPGAACSMFVSTITQERIENSVLQVFMASTANLAPSTQKPEKFAVLTVSETTGKMVMEDDIVKDQGSILNGSAEKTLITKILKSMKRKNRRSAL